PRYRGDRGQRIGWSDDHEVRLAQRGPDLWRALRRVDPGEGDALTPRLQTLAHEVLLEGQLSCVGSESRTDRVVGHRHHARLDAKARTEHEGRFGQRASAAQHVGSYEVRGEVLVAYTNPRRLADFVERVEDPEGVALDAVSRLVVEDAGQAVDDRVDVRTDQEAPELVVVRGVRSEERRVGNGS